MPFSKDFISDTLLYLTSTFLLIFLAKVTPTVRHDSLGMKVVFIGIPKIW
jgi:hypothetical protein